VNKPIYIVFSCDAWKSRDSMRLVAATTSHTKLKKIVSNCVETEMFEYGEGDAKTSASQLRKDFDNGHSVYGINDSLKYGFIDVVDDGVM